MASITTMSRTERYCRRLDERLESTHPNERLKFLKNEQAEWIGRYERFTDRVDKGQKPDWGESAFDYAETLSEISKRISQHEVVS